MKLVATFIVQKMGSLGLMFLGPIMRFLPSNIIAQILKIKQQHCGCLQIVATILIRSSLLDFLQRIIVFVQIFIAWTGRILMPLECTFSPPVHCFPVKSRLARSRATLSLANRHNSGGTLNAAEIVQDCFLELYNFPFISLDRYFPLRWSQACVGGL